MLRVAAVLAIPEAATAWLLDDLEEAGCVAGATPPAGMATNGTSSGTDLSFDAANPC
jgi:hypothetical protein